MSRAIGLEKEPRSKEVEEVEGLQNEEAWEWEPLGFKKKSKKEQDNKVVGQMVQMRQNKGLTGRYVLAFQGDGVEGIRVNRRLKETDVHQAAAGGLTGSARPLPYLEQIQRAFGEHDVTGVKAYIGGAAQVASDKMGALAYAAGDSIAFRDAPDLRLVAHEAAHIIQQRAGVQLKDGVGQEGDVYERHADDVAEAVVAGRSAKPLLDRIASPKAESTSREAVQFWPRRAVNFMQGRGQPQGGWVSIVEELERFKLQGNTHPQLRTRGVDPNLFSDELAGMLERILQSFQTGTPDSELVLDHFRLSGYQDFEVWGERLRTTEALEGLPSFNMSLSYDDQCQNPVQIEWFFDVERDEDGSLQTVAIRPVITHTQRAQGEEGTSQQPGARMRAIPPDVYAKVCGPGGAWEHFNTPNGRRDVLDEGENFGVSCVSLRPWPSDAVPDESGLKPHRMVVFARQRVGEGARFRPRMPGIRCGIMAPAQLEQISKEDLFQWIRERIEAKCAELNLDSTPEAQLSGTEPQNRNTTALQQPSSPEETEKNESGSEQAGEDSNRRVRAGQTTSIIPSSFTSEQREVAVRVLGEIFGETQFEEETEQPTEPLTLSLSQNDLNWLARLDLLPQEKRAEILAVIHELFSRSGSGSGPAANLANLLETAYATYQTRQLRERLGLRQMPLPEASEDEDDDQLEARPVRGRVVINPDNVTTGTDTSFKVEFWDLPRRSAVGQVGNRPDVEVLWHIVRSPEGQESAPNQFLVRSRLGRLPGRVVPGFNDDAAVQYSESNPLEMDFSEAGTYEVYAFVTHNHFIANSFFKAFNVRAQGEVLDDFETQVGNEEEHIEEGWGEAERLGSTNNLINPDTYAYSGELPEGIDGGEDYLQENFRLEREISTLRAQIQEYPSGDPVRNALVSRIKRLQRWKREIGSVANGGDKQPIAVQGFFASRDDGAASSVLHLTAFFKRNRHASISDTYEGDLFDTTGATRAQRLHFTANYKPSFLFMMESLFENLCQEYPNGRISFSFQKFIAEGHQDQPTQEFIRLRKETMTVGRHITSVVTSLPAQVIVNLGSLLLSLFPPTAPLGIAVGFAYNAATAAHEAARAANSDNLRDEHMLDLAMCIVDLIPMTRLGRTVTRVGERVYKTLDIAQTSIDVWLMTEEAQREIATLREQRAVALQQTAMALHTLSREQEAAATPAGRRRLEQLQRQHRQQREELIQTSTEVFLRLAGTQAIMRAPSAIVNRVRSNHNNETPTPSPETPRRQRPSHGATNPEHPGLAEMTDNARVSGALRDLGFDLNLLRMMPPQRQAQSDHDPRNRYEELGRAVLDAHYTGEPRGTRPDGTPQYSQEDITSKARRLLQDFSPEQQQQLMRRGWAGSRPSEHGPHSTTPSQSPDNSPTPSRDPEFARTLDRLVESDARLLVDHFEQRPDHPGRPNQLNTWAATSRAGVAELNIVSRRFENMYNPSLMNRTRPRNFSGITMIDNNTFRISPENTNKYMDKIKTIYETAGTPLNSHMEEMILTHLRRSRTFSSAHTLPGLHAEIFSVNDIFNQLQRQGVDLDTFDLSQIQVATRRLAESSATIPRQGEFPACHNCTNILHPDIQVITGRTSE